MKIASFFVSGRKRVGIVSGNDVFLASEEINDPLFFLADTSIQEKTLKNSVAYSIENLKFLPPITNPEKIFLVALNYRSHLREQSRKEPAFPYFFTKFRNSLVEHKGNVVIPRVSKQVDWEVELAVVIGKKCKYVSKSQASDYIAGYTIANDISFRDLQNMRTNPANLGSLERDWVRGKGLDNSFPLGPWIVTTDEIGDPSNLSIELSVNGVTKQKGNTSDMIFSVQELISELSQGITLMPGDIISTGTPSGVAAFSSGEYLKKGDVLESRIEKVGVLTNYVIEES